MVKLITLSTIYLTLKAGVRGDKEKGISPQKPITTTIPPRVLVQFEEDEAEELVRIKAARYLIAGVDKSLPPEHPVPDHLSLVSDDTDEETAAAIARMQENDQAAQAILRQQEEAKRAEAAQRKAEVDAERKRLAAVRAEEDAQRQKQSQATVESAGTGGSEGDGSEGDGSEDSGEEAPATTPAKPVSRAKATEASKTKGKAATGDAEKSSDDSGSDLV